MRKWQIWPIKLRKIGKEWPVKLRKKIDKEWQKIEANAEKLTRK